jgi:hypothetical protein
MAGIGIVPWGGCKKYYSDVLGFETFEEYCKKKWDMSLRHCERLMSSAKVVDITRPIGRLPLTESQARPLSQLNENLQCEAWSRAVESVPDGKVTAA